jgi:hypothetical protein
VLRARLQLALAHVWLLLGADEQALAAIGPEDDMWPAPMQVRRCWTLACVAAIRGEAVEPHRRRMGELQAEQRDVPMIHSPWLEWSQQGDAGEVAEQMRRVSALCEAAGRPGIARTATMRRIDRLGEIDDTAAIETAAALARELRPQLTSGLSAFVSLPEAWFVISKAMARAGDAKAASEWLVEARTWIHQVALPNVPPTWRDSFLKRNPVNRELLLMA